jgi:hypothetical protein
VLEDPSPLLSISRRSSIQQQAEFLLVVGVLLWRRADDCYY